MYTHLQAFNFYIGRPCQISSRYGVHSDRFRVRTQTTDWYVLATTLRQHLTIEYAEGMGTLHKQKLPRVLCGFFTHKNKYAIQNNDQVATNVLYNSVQNLKHGKRVSQIWAWAT